MKGCVFSLVFSLAVLFMTSDGFGQIRTITIVDMPASITTLKVFKYQEGKLVDVSGKSLQGQSISQPILQKDKENNIYVSYLDLKENRAQISVMKFDGNIWTAVGKPVSSSGSGYYDFKIDNLDRPVIVFEDEKFSRKLTAMHFNGINWQPLGNRGFTSQTSAKAIKLAFDAENRAHVLYGYFDFRNHRYPISILVYSGRTWTRDRNFKIEVESKHSPIIRDYLIGPSGTQYLAYGFQSGSNRPGMKIFEYADAKTNVLIDKGKYSKYSNPAIGADETKGLFVLCSSYLKEKSTRTLNLFELKNRNLLRIDPENRTEMAYAMRSNLAYSPGGNLGFLFTKYESTGKVAVTFMCSNNGRLERKGKYTFDNISGISVLRLVFDNNDVPYIALLLFK